MKNFKIVKVLDSNNNLVRHYHIKVLRKFLFIPYYEYLAIFDKNGNPIKWKCFRKSTAEKKIEMLRVTENKILTI